MSGDQTAVLIAAGIGVFGGIVASTIPAWLQRHEALRSARRDAYRTVLAAVHDFVRWADLKHPMLSYEGAPEPEYPAVATIVETQALVSLYATDTTRERFRAFVEAVNDFKIVADELSEERARKERSESGRSLWKEIRGKREVVHEMLEPLAEAMRHDIESGVLRAKLGPLLRWLPRPRRRRPSDQADASTS